MVYGYVVFCVRCRRATFVASREWADEYQARNCVVCSDILKLPLMYEAIESAGQREVREFVKTLDLYPML